jgi:hypothetical protein
MTRRPHGASPDHRLREHRANIDRLSDAAERMRDRMQGKKRESGKGGLIPVDMDAVAKELLSGDVPDDPDRDLMREIGERLGRAGGRGLMVLVVEEVALTRGEKIAARVSTVWEGIGGWSR